MSLINEALKKAQHQRSGPTDLPPMPGGGSGGRGSSGMPKGILVLMIAGAFVVVVISVVATVIFVNRSPAPKAVVASAPVQPVSSPTVTPPAPTEVKAPDVPAPATSSVAIAPVTIKIPLAAAPAPNAPTPPVVEAAPVTAAPTPAATAPATPAATETAPVAVTEPAASGSLADRIADYVDKLRVTGIRTSETGGSKVLMNDKVYRANDVVNRALGLKLIKISADSLTFADATGATYVKNF